MTLTRRQFAGAGALSLAALRLHADPLGMPIGTQVYPLRNDLAKDFPGTLRDIAAMGYRTIEMCSPPTYAEFRPLIEMKAADMRKTIEAAGLRCESCHYGFR